MKSLQEYITESSYVSNKLGYFMGKTSRRTQEDFKFTPGEKAILISYRDYGRFAVLSSKLHTIEKVDKNSVKIKSDGEWLPLDLKFNKYGICVMQHHTRYGKSNIYKVLYNAELANDKDIEELLNTGRCAWDYRFPQQSREEDTELLKKLLNEINK